MDDESDESMELMDEVPPKEPGVRQNQGRPERGISDNRLRIQNLSGEVTSAGSKQSTKG